MAEPLVRRDRGRPQASSAARVAQHAQDLFEAKGYGSTTIDDITGAAGISRRAFFSYFPSKADVFWFDRDLKMHIFAGFLDRRIAQGTEPIPAIFDTFRASVVTADDDRREIERRFYASVHQTYDLTAAGSVRRRQWSTMLVSRIVPDVSMIIQHDRVLLEALVDGAVIVIDSIMQGWATHPETDVVEMMAVATGTLEMALNTWSPSVQIRRGVQVDV